MQEIYLPAFQAAVQQGAASSVMCSYSWINGTAACQNPYTLNTVLRQQFGFTGFVTSDWGATHSTAASANAGLDHGHAGQRRLLRHARCRRRRLRAGEPGARSTRRCREILTEMFAFGLFDKAPSGSPSATATNSTHQADATQLAEEGTVLLKNSGSVLPLTSADKSIAVIGADASTSPQTAGGGSAGVNSSGTVTPLQGIQAAAPAAPPSPTTRLLRQLGRVGGRRGQRRGRLRQLGESEGCGPVQHRPGTTQDNLISAVAAANPNTIVVLNTGCAVTMPWLSSVKGVLEAWYPGQEDGTAIASVLFGDYRPLRPPDR